MPDLRGVILERCGVTVNAGWLATVKVPLRACRRTGSEQPLLSYLPNHEVQAKGRLLAARFFATRTNVVGRLANAYRKATVSAEAGIA